MNKKSSEIRKSTSRKISVRIALTGFLVAAINLYDSATKSNASYMAAIGLLHSDYTTFAQDLAEEGIFSSQKYSEFKNQIGPIKTVYSNVNRVVYNIEPPRSDMDHHLPLRKASAKAVSSPKLKTVRKPEDSGKRNEIFGATLIGFGKIATGQRFSNYIGGLQESKGDVAALCEGSKCQYRLAAFQTHMKERDLDFLEKLKFVNRFVNKSIIYADDRVTYGQTDRWSLPHETLNRGVGDCEDFAILKMAMLSKLGVPKKAMSIIVLEDTSRSLYHAVLAVQTNVGTFILDNVTPAVRKDIEIASYRPLFAIGASRNHVFGYKKGGGQQIASALDFAKIAPQARTE